MASDVNSADVGRRTPVGPLLFCAVLFLIGLTFVGVAVRRALTEPEPATPERDLAAEARDYLRRNKPAPLSEPLAKLLADPESFRVASQPHPLLGKKAPDFTRTTVVGNSWTLSQALERGPVVLVFYFGYHCNHCVSQLFDLAEDHGRFRELGAEVVALSADPADLTKQRYKQYGSFPFPVIPDSNNAVAESYGAFRAAKDDEPENLDHGTFVVARDGTVQFAYLGAEPFASNRTLLFEVARLEGRLP